jgi:hypothetical protein
MAKSVFDPPLHMHDVRVHALDVRSGLRAQTGRQQHHPALRFRSNTRGVGTGRVDALVADFEFHRFPSNVPRRGSGGTKFKESETDASARGIFKTCYGV